MPKFGSRMVSEPYALSAFAYLSRGRLGWRMHIMVLTWQKELENALTTLHSDIWYWLAFESVNNMLRLGAAHCASAYQAPELQLNGPRCRPFVAGHFNLRPRVRVLDNCIVCAAFRPEAGTRKVSDAISKQSKSIVIGSLSILLGLSVHTGMSQLSRV